MPSSKNSGESPGSVQASATAGVLEQRVPLSASAIWRMQRDYYAARGIAAWSEDAVPQYISNNPLIAEQYARVVSQFVADSRKAGISGAVRILEIGAGPGKFCFLFLRQLRDMLASRGESLQTIRYTMADCSPASLQAWRSNPRLAEFVSEGVLDFQVFEAGGTSLWDSLSGSPSVPVVVIANYVLDSLPQDAFVVGDGSISEALVTTQRGSAAQPAAIAGLKLTFENVAVPPNRYPDGACNAILEDYRSKLTNATVLFPSVALAMIKNLREACHRPMLFLVGDKGFVHESELTLSRGTPAIEFHTPNCFSQMVNFDAVAKYFAATGGRALLPDKHTPGFRICAFVSARDSTSTTGTDAAFREVQLGFGPDDAFALLAWLHPKMEQIPVREILALLRLGRWDPVMLMRLFHVLEPQLQRGAVERVDVRDAALRCRGNHYPLTASERDFDFQCGVILLKLDYFAEAQGCFLSAIAGNGASAPASYNLALCYEGLGNHAEALRRMAEACEIDRGFAPAQEGMRLLRGTRTNVTNSAVST